MMPRLYIARIDPALEADERTFSAYRLDRLRIAASPKRRAEGISAERLLLCALRDVDPGMQLPPVIRTEEQGRPVLADSSLWFSLSHSGDFCACALCGGAVGADIQRIVPMDRRVMERKFSAAEREYVLDSENMDAAFTRVWTMKESLLKALGIGLTRPPSEFCTFSADAGFKTGEHEGHIYSICVPGMDAANADIKFVPSDAI